MPTQILMPALSPTMEEGTLAKWLVKEGDSVNPGDLLAEIETDKAVMEFEAVDEGVIGKLLVTEGTEGVKVNAPIATLLADGESADDAPKSVNEDLRRAENGLPAKAKSDDRSPSSERGPDTSPTPDKSVPSVAPGSHDVSAERIFASPLARRIARDKDVDLASVMGSGPKGRIVKADVETAHPVKSSSQQQTETAATAQTTDTAAIAQIYEGREFEEIKLDGMRKTVAARLTEAKRTIPHFYLRRDVRLDALVSFRTELNRQLEPRGIKLSINDFIIKACALALQQVPAANAVWAGDRILRFASSDVAVAVAVEGGLFTPVLKDAQAKTLSALSSEMKDLATRARARKLAPQEYQGGSFSISNLGMYGIDNFDAVINPPHAAILAVGAGVKKPVVNGNGDIVAATVLSLTMSVDHRVIDGVLGAELLSAITSNLENPMAMLA